MMLKSPVAPAYLMRSPRWIMNVCSGSVVPTSTSAYFTIAAICSASSRAARNDRVDRGADLLAVVGQLHGQHHHLVATGVADVADRHTRRKAVAGTDGPMMYIRLLPMHHERVVEAQLGVENGLPAGLQRDDGRESRRRDDIRVTQGVRSIRVGVRRVGVANRFGELADLLPADFVDAGTRIDTSDVVAVQRPLSSFRTSGGDGSNGGQCVPVGVDGSANATRVCSGTALNERRTRAVTGPSIPRSNNPSVCSSGHSGPRRSAMAGAISKVFGSAAETSREARLTGGPKKSPSCAMTRP